MAHTFDIRFDRVAGVASLLDTPQNRFGWRGGGRLYIDAQGISIAVKRGLLSLLARPRSQRIPAASIREVYREGDALRVEFASGEDPRITLPFWATDRATAAQIVQLLPTSRTVEVEHGPTESPHRARPKRLSLMMATAVVLVVACGALFLNVRRPAAQPPAPASIPPDAAPIIAVPGSPPPPPDTDAPAAGVLLPAPRSRPAPMSWEGDPITPEQARRRAIMEEEPVDWTPPPAADPAAEGETFAPSLPDVALRGDAPVVRISPTTLLYGTARELLGKFEVEAADLSAGYLRELERFDSGKLDARAFADQLDWYALRWRNLVARVLESRRFSDPGLTGLRATLASVIVSQRSFLTGYAEGLRTSEQARIDRAFEDLARAEQQLARARLYLT